MKEGDKKDLVVECRNCGSLLRVPDEQWPSDGDRVEIKCNHSDCGRTYSYDVDDVFVPSELDGAFLSLQEGGLTLADVIRQIQKQEP